MILPKLAVCNLHDPSELRNNIHLHDSLTKIMKRKKDTQHTSVMKEFYILKEKKKILMIVCKNNYRNHQPLFYLGKKKITVYNETIYATCHQYNI